MPTHSKDYLMTLPVEFHSIDNQNSSCESAFVEHLKLLKKSIPQNESIHIIAPSMGIEKYIDNKEHLGKINSNNDGIKVTTLNINNVGRLSYLFLKSFSIYKTIKSEINNARIVHSGPSSDPLRPFEIFSIILAKKASIPSIFVIDIDHRSSAKMDHITGKLSTKSYLLRKFIYDPFLSWQIKYAVKNCSLVLLKSKSLVKDYGKNKSHVKNFLDTAHNASAILSNEKLSLKLKSVIKNRIRLVYFGRLTEYKGIVDMITVTHKCKKKGLDVELSIIGEGEQKEELQTTVKELNAFSYIHFKPGIPYGPKLFSELLNYDILLAAPQRQDTPRNVFDAMANGLGTIAYDTYYYNDLLSTGAVITTPWLNTELMSTAIINLASDTSKLQNMIKSAVVFAKENTQEHWLKKRNDWLLNTIESNNHATN